MFGVDRTVLGENGRPEHNRDGTVRKERVCMADTQLKDGSPQRLYYPPDHPRAGVFRGMVELLEERGYRGVRNLRFECKDFKCANKTDRCCCRRLLYNEPDFVHVESLLEAKCRGRGFTVVFLPKFHCELNPIEQVWCHSKRVYRLNPPTSRPNDLKANVVNALESVDVDQIRR
jgi:hypothetical protein